MTQRITPTLTLPDSTFSRIYAEAARLGTDADSIMSELLTAAAAGLSGGPAPDAAEPEPDYLTPADVAARLRLQPRTVAAYCRTGKIRAQRVGNRWRITPDAVTEYLEGEH